MKKIFFVLFTFISTIGLYAQNDTDPVIFEINGNKIYKSEFMKEFLRSVGKDPKAAPTACTYEKRQALTEYVELFVNYRTKLADAYSQGFDTMPDMLKELKGYRNELAAPYLIDSVTLNNILREAYERNHYALHAAHILVTMPRNPSPEDTLQAYNEAMNYYNRAIAGENFSKLAHESATKRAEKQGLDIDDPRRKDNGDLGNFTVFDMVYPFESAAYSLNPGEISKPIRTSFGYHVILLVDKTPYFGKSTFQHIWCATHTDTSRARRHIMQAYSKLLEGENFNMVCRNYSDDNSTSENGGMLVDMAIRQIPSEYVSVLSRMQSGDVSVPFETQYGWHILRLIKRDSLPSFEEMAPFYRQKMVRDSRSDKPRSAFVEQSKTRYGFIDYTKMYEKSQKGKKSARRALASLDECRAALSDSLFTKSWHFQNSMVTDMRPLFSVGDKEYNAVDFLKFVEKKQRVEGAIDLDYYLEERYANFINDKVFEYADNHLEAEHPEFAELMEEYRNGLMIFAYNDKMIWSKAIKDTVGLDKFYAMTSQNHSIDNEDDAPYFWGERLNMTIFDVPDSGLLATSKAMKIMNKSAKKNESDKIVFEKIKKESKDGSLLKMESLIVEKERQNILTASQCREGVYIVPDKSGYRIVKVNNILNPQLKTRTEARGYYINDYQNYLESQLIENLRKKYNVIIHQDVIDEITY